MWSILLGAATFVSLSAACTPSNTTVSGTNVPDIMCSGALIFEDNFDEFDLKKWQHENTLGGGGNWEFQYYSDNSTNSFTQNGIFYIRPSLTSDQYGEDFLTSGHWIIENCTNSQWYGCDRTGTPTNILNPIISARVDTSQSFSFRYGRLEVRAKMPVGDWLWPAIWLMPANSTYGIWPASGEIDLVESRGNRNLILNGVNIGTQQVASTLHYGPNYKQDGAEKAHWVKSNCSGFDKDFHLYQLEWTPEYLGFSVDNVELGRATPGVGGFWEYGGFDNNETLNPWRDGSNMTPFDQTFYIIINLAVGGTNSFFSDNATNPTPKPWANDSPTAMKEFWNARDEWLPTWNLTGKDQDSSLQVDYIRVWAL